MMLIWKKMNIEDVFVGVVYIRLINCCLLFLVYCLKIFKNGYV